MNMSHLHPVYNTVAASPVPRSHVLSVYLPSRFAPYYPLRPPARNSEAPLALDSTPLLLPAPLVSDVAAGAVVVTEDLTEAAAEAEAATPVTASPAPSHTPDSD